MKSKNTIFTKKIGQVMLLPLFMLFLMIALTSRVHATPARIEIGGTFKDYNFRHYIETNFSNLITRENGKEYLTAEAIAKIKVIDINGNNGKKYSNLTGIEYFTELEELYCNNNNLSNLNVTNFTKLRILHCEDNNLAYLNLNSNTQLRELYCQNNKLTSLNLEKNQILMELNCRDNKIKSLELKNNHYVKNITCQNNELAYLGLSLCSELQSLYCYNNQLKTLNLSNSRKVTYISCESNQLESLNVSFCSALAIMDCSSNKLTALDVNHNPKLTSLICHTNLLTGLSVRNNPVLAELYCYNNNFYNLEVCENGTLHKAIKAAKPEPNAFGQKYYRNSTGSIALWADNKVDIYALPSNIKEDPVVDEAGVRRFVTGFYYTILGRGPVNGEENDWINKLCQRKINGETIARGFIFSPEFERQRVGNRVYVTKLYQTFLGRNPINNEEQGWVNNLEYGKSREYVLAGFVNSPEFDKACKALGIERGNMVVKNPNAPTAADDPSIPRLKIISTKNVSDAQLTAYVQRMYLKAFDRPAEPQGLAYWKKCILEGKDAERNIQYDAINVPRKGFFESTEYIRKNTNDRQFVTDAYRVFLNREPEQDGMDYWLDQLAMGRYTRASMLDIGFGNSVEFKKLLESYGFEVGY